MGFGETLPHLGLFKLMSYQMKTSNLTTWSCSHNLKT